MFIRCARTRTTNSGKSYHSYRLVDSYRAGDRVRQRTLLNLGTQFSIPRAQWPELTQRVEHIIQGQHDVLVAPAPEVERKAQEIVATLLNRYARSDLVAAPLPASAHVLRPALHAPISPSLSEMR